MCRSGTSLASGIGSGLGSFVLRDGTMTADAGDRWRPAAASTHGLIGMGGAGLSV